MAARSSAAWRTCQSRSFRALASASSTSGPSNGARASTARRRTAGLSWVAARMAGKPAGIADRSEGRDRGLPHQRIVVVGRQPREAIDDVAPSALVETGELATGPRRRLDNGGIGVVEQSEHRRPRARRDPRRRPLPRRAGARRRRRLQRRARDRRGVNAPARASAPSAVARTRPSSSASAGRTVATSPR